MCGRYTLRRPGLLVKLEYQNTFAEFSELKIQPRFNICPSQQIAIIRNQAGPHPALAAVEWGLIPSWAKQRSPRTPINARSDKVGTSGMYRPALQCRRCLIPADGFYEWRATDAGRKQPYYIRFADERLFFFAGLWERWTDPETSDSIDTAALITTEPNQLMRPIHNRMPVLLTAAAADAWLSEETSEQDAMTLLQPFPDTGELTAYPVNTIARPGSEDPTNVEPLKSAPAGQLSFDF